MDMVLKLALTLTFLQTIIAIRYKELVAIITFTAMPVMIQSIAMLGMILSVRGKATT